MVEPAVGLHHALKALSTRPRSLPLESLAIPCAASLERLCAAVRPLGNRAQCLPARMPPGVARMLQTKGVA
jgi:hypothetical protein